MAIIKIIAAGLVLLTGTVGIVIAGIVAAAIIAEIIRK